MRKFIVLLAALAVAVTVQTPQRAMAQTTPASKDANGTISLTAQQKKQTAAPVRAAPARTVAQPTRPTRSVAQPTRPTRTVTQPTKPTRTVTQPTKPTRAVTQPTKPIRTVTQPTKPTRTVKTGLTQGPGKVTKRNITQGPGKLTTKRVISRGPGLNKGNRTVTALQRNRVVRSDRGNYRGWRGGPSNFVINRDRRRIFVNNGWRTLVPLVALGTFWYDDETYYADGYVSVPEPVCNGFTEDGSRLRWLAVPTEDGGSEYQCVAYSTQRHRTITEITVPAERVAEPETVGVGSANEPAVASPEPTAAPTTGCELLIYSETNFKGMSTPADEDQPGLSENGWQNEITSVQIKSGTWDFYSDEDYAGEMMRLSAGSYPTLDPKWSKHIGSFMCSAPAK
jgi:Beta/Gamma crystallin